MVKSNVNRELLDLSTAASEDQLDAEAIARLEEILGPSDEMCAAWLELMQFHANLRSLAAASSAERKALASVGAHPEASESSAANSPFAKVRQRRRSLTWLGVLAANLLIVLTIFASRNGNNTITEHESRVTPTLVVEEKRIVHLSQQVASLAEEKNAVWSYGEKYQLGHFFDEGAWLSLEAGTAQISMTSGADVVLQAPCTVVLTSDFVVQLKRGTVTVQAAEWAHGFVVETQGLRVTDLGTRFAVSAESPDLTEAHVLAGSILAEPLRACKQTEAKLLLTSGEAIRVGTQTASIDRLVAQRGRFVEDFSSFHPFRPVELYNTGRGFEVGEEDPRWRITFGDLMSGPWPRPAIVNPPNPRYSDNAPERSQWISIAGGTKSGSSSGVSGDTVFTFETVFDLTEFDPATVTIAAHVLADNGVRQVRLNGKPVVMEPWEDHNPDQKFWTFRKVEIADGFIRGLNSIEIDVFNSPAKKGSRNPMALRVEWQAFGRPLAGSNPP